jgi:hypothetical protein
MNRRHFGKLLSLAAVGLLLPIEAVARVFGRPPLNIESIFLASTPAVIADLRPEWKHMPLPFGPNEGLFIAWSLKDDTRNPGENAKISLVASLLENAIDSAEYLAGGRRIIGWSLDKRYSPTHPELIVYDFQVTLELA